MKKIITKLIPILLEIEPIKEYLTQYKNYKIIYEDINTDNGEIDISCNNEIIKIIYTNHE